MGKSGGGFYAVAAGRSTGVFHSWSEAETQVKGFAGARFKKFPTLAQAQAFVASAGGGSGTTSRQLGGGGERKRGREEESEAGHAPQRQKTEGSTFYAVVEGRQTGVFDAWSDVRRHTDGFARPIVRTFDSRHAAQAYLDGYAAATGARSSAQTLSLSGSGSTASSSRPERAALGSSVLLTTADRASTPPRSCVVVDDGKDSRPGQFWYAVAKGRQTGVFATWKEAKQHVDGLYSASFKKFPTREEAEAFVNKFAQATGKMSNDPDPHDPNTLVAFCDGSALQNGRRGCQAGYACIFPHHQEWNVVQKLVEDRATNNRAEYFAALKAIKRANIEDPARKRLLYIFSDSMLLIRSMTEWVDKWKAKGWRKADGKAVMNQDILESLLREKGSRRILWRHVKAHTGGTDWKSKWNDVADRSARGAAGSS